MKKTIIQKPILKGKPLLVNAGIKKKYQKELRKIVRRAILLTRTMLKNVIPAVRAEIAHTATDSAIDDFENDIEHIHDVVNDYIEEFSKVYLGTLFLDIDHNTTKMLAQQFKTMFNDISSPLAMSIAPTSFNPNTMEAWIFENVSLIKKITDNYFTQITTDVMQIFTAGLSREDLKQRIFKIGQTTLRRADLIAEDQISKAYMSLNLQKFKEAGIEKFEWIHTHGGLTPRQYHLHVLNGKIFDIKNPPIIDQRTGETGFPGQAPFCRCVMRPILN